MDSTSPHRATDDRPGLAPGRHAAGASPAALLVGLVSTAIALLQACSFTAPSIQSPQDVYDILDESRYVEPYAGDRWTVVDDPMLRVEHGWSCAEASRAASSEYIGLRVGGFTQLPPNFDGTVFLNGWYLDYKKKDHHVVGFGTSIFNIAQLNSVLVWNAGGVISDHNGDDAYRWCYDYTTVAWPRPSSSPIFDPIFKPRVDVQAIHSDPRASLMFVDGPSAGGMSEIPSSYRAKGKAPRGVLLAGFGSSYTDDDHHVLQIGFDLGRTKVKRKKIKWTSDVIFRDDNGDDPVRSASIVSVLKGESVHVYHPPLAEIVDGDAPRGTVGNDILLVPRSGGSSGACLGSVSERTVQLAITTPPYTWAIPMLTGWNLGSPCADNHVTKAGAAINDFSYERASGASHGTLHVTVTTSFGDKDGFPGMFDDVQIDVLGINRIEPPGKDPGDGGGLPPIGPVGPNLPLEPAAGF